MATNLNDFEMLVELENGDLFSHDTVYHKESTFGYYNRHKSSLHKTQSNHTMIQSELECIALAENVAYVVEDDSDGPFYIIELAELCTSRFKKLGGAVPGRIHTPRFQERILSQIPLMKGHKAEKKLSIACEADNGKAAARELHRSSDHDACNITETTTNLREKIFDLQQSFHGEFPVEFCFPNVVIIYWHVVVWSFCQT